MNIKEEKVLERKATVGADTLSVVTVCFDQDLSREIRRILDSISLVEVAGELQTYLTTEQGSDPAQLIRSLQPDVCFINFDRDPQSASPSVTRIKHLSPQTAVFSVSSDPHPDLIMLAMRCGCADYLVRPLDEEHLIGALARVSDQKRERAQHFSGTVLGFVGAKGGVGTTTLAVHLTALLAQRHSKKCLLVDCHWDLGHVQPYLGLPGSNHGFHELLGSAHKLDENVLRQHLSVHKSGFDVIAASDGSAPPLSASPEAIEYTIQFLRLDRDYVVLDCGSVLDETTKGLIDQCQELYMVTTPDVPALRSAARYVECLSRLQYPQEKIRLVLNRHQKGGAITQSDIAKALRQPVFWKCPSQFKEVASAISHGSPFSLASASEFHPHSEFQRSLAGLAETIAGKAVPKGKKPRRMLDI